MVLHYPLVMLHCISVNFSQVYRFMQNLFMCKVHNLVFIIHLLVIRINCVANKLKLE